MKIERDVQVIAEAANMLEVFRDSLLKNPLSQISEESRENLKDTVKKINKIIKKLMNEK